MRTRDVIPWMATLLLAITLVGTLDLIFDIAIKVPAVHQVTEIIFVLLCLVTGIYLGVGWRRSHRSLARLRANEQRARVFMEGLGKAIEMQLSEWGLSECERMTALLILKGMSHREIAVTTQRSESTVRQQAVEIYRKSGLSGRAELSAFFLEDLLLPNTLPGVDIGTGDQNPGLHICSQTDNVRILKNS